MKIYRSTKCSLKFANARKLRVLRRIIEEYGRVVNFFIDEFWLDPPRLGELLKPIIDLPGTWLSYNMRVTAAREAVHLAVSTHKKGGRKPRHSGKSMRVRSKLAQLKEANPTSEFDAWLHLRSIGARIIFDLPIKFHEHYHKLAAKGTRCNSCILTASHAQFFFEIETGPKREKGVCIGVDTGIKKLAALSTGQKLGTDIESCVSRINRCQYGSKGQKRARRSLRQRMDEVAKEITSTGPRLVVVEDLKKLNQKTKLKRRLSRNMRRALGSWAYAYWLGRLQQACEWGCSTFRRVRPEYTSQMCSACGHTEKRNRKGEKFLCQSCGHTDDADINAARNILDRFLSGPYGARFKPSVIC